MARATITEFWLGISMDVISSIEPEAETFGRCARPTTSAMSTMRLMPMATTLAGGKFLAAVPYSSLMSKLVPDSGVVDGAEGGVGATGGFSSGIGNPRERFYSSSRPDVFHGFRELLCRQRIEDIVPRKPVAT